MPMGETYDAISRGVVDGTMAPQESTKGWRWGEVIGSSTQDFGAAYTTGFLCRNEQAKMEFPSSDIQKVFRDVNREWAEKNGSAWDIHDKEARGLDGTTRQKIIPLSPEKTRDGRRS